MIPADNPFVDAAEELGADILLLNGGMMPGVDDAVRKIVDARTSARTRLVLVLVTPGGIPDVAYRIAMILRGRYESISVCISGWCKSAGTLLAINGNDLIMGTHGEMGPLDVRIAKRDDLGGDRDSGLVINEALSRLRGESFDLFEEFMLRIIASSSNLVTFRTAADVAAQLTIGLMAPIFEKIDPMRMGADARAMNIGEEYAIRLNAKGGNLKGSDALNMLLNGYPSHSFVIDINEAENLFTRVKPLEGKLAEGVANLGKLARNPASDGPLVCYLEGTNDGEADADDASEAELSDAGGDRERVEHEPPSDVRRDHEEVTGQEGTSAEG